MLRWLMDLGGLLGSAWELPREEGRGDGTKPRAEGSSQDILLPHWVGLINPARTCDMVQLLDGHPLIREP